MLLHALVDDHVLFLPNTPIPMNTIECFASRSYRHYVLILRLGIGNEARDESTTVSAHLNVKIA